MQVDLSLFISCRNAIPARLRKSMQLLTSKKKSTTSKPFQQLCNLKRVFLLCSSFLCNSILISHYSPSSLKREPQTIMKPLCSGPQLWWPFSAVSLKKVIPYWGFHSAKWPHHHDAIHNLLAPNFSLAVPPPPLENLDAMCCDQTAPGGSDNAANV